MQTCWLWSVGISLCSPIHVPKQVWFAFDRHQLISQQKRHVLLAIVALWTCQIDQAVTWFDRHATNRILHIRATRLPIDLQLRRSRGDGLYMCSNSKPFSFSFNELSTAQISIHFLYMLQLVYLLTSTFAASTSVDATTKMVSQHKIHAWCVISAVLYPSQIHRDPLSTYRGSWSETRSQVLIKLLHGNITPRTGLWRRRSSPAPPFPPIPTRAVACQ